jgi:predicted alpha/beta-hydrolase family hydrolase
MIAYEITSLAISGYAGKAVPNRLFRQTTGSHTLAVVFPGLHYTADMPLLYYTSKVLTGRRCDVLQVNVDYTISAYRSLPAEERARWLAADASAAYGVGIKYRDYTQLILAGKSIGTLALTHLIGSGTGTQAITIWLTPLLRQAQLVTAARQCSQPALFVAGTADPNFDDEALTQICTNRQAELVLIEGADHSLEIPTDLFGSLRALDEILTGIDDFLERHGVRNNDPG